jgi:hypothetical protein
MKTRMRAFLLFAGAACPWTVLSQGCIICEKCILIEDEGRSWCMSAAGATGVDGQNQIRIISAAEEDPVYQFNVLGCRCLTPVETKIMELGGQTEDDAQNLKYAAIRDLLTGIAKYQCADRAAALKLKDPTCAEILAQAQPFPRLDAEEAAVKCDSPAKGNPAPGTYSCADVTFGGDGEASGFPDAKAPEAGKDLPTTQ